MKRKNIKIEIQKYKELKKLVNIDDIIKGK